MYKIKIEVVRHLLHNLSTNLAIQNFGQDLVSFEQEIDFGDEFGFWLLILA